ncbi:MAG: GerW family sporulation protein [Lachnospiraceae bacterium]|nr:GerW family sporulation protein [Lachnospiraceae bacterium]
MADGKFSSTVSSLFQGMEAFLTTKTVVGDAVKFDDGTIILPLVDVSFGMGAGSFVNGAKDNSGGGMSGKMTPSAVLVIQNGHARLVNVKNQDALTKIFDMVPDLVDKFTKDDAAKEKEKETDEMAAEIVRETETKLENS